VIGRCRKCRRRFAQLGGREDVCNCCALGKAVQDPSRRHALLALVSRCRRLARVLRPTLYLPPRGPNVHHALFSGIRVACGQNQMLTGEELIRTGSRFGFRTSWFIRVNFRSRSSCLRKRGEIFVAGVSPFSKGTGSSVAEGSLACGDEWGALRLSSPWGIQPLRFIAQRESMTCR